MPADPKRVTMEYIMEALPDFTHTVEIINLGSLLSLLDMSSAASSLAGLSLRRVLQVFAFAALVLAYFARVNAFVGNSQLGCDVLQRSPRTLRTAGSRHFGSVCGQAGGGCQGSQGASDRSCLRALRQEHVGLAGNPNRCALLHN